MPSSWEYGSYFKPVVMSDERNFSRPREPFIASTSPLDLQSLDDEESFSYLRYILPPERKKKLDEVKKKVEELEAEEKPDVDEKPEETDDKKKKDEKKDTSASNLIKSWQSFLGASHPLIGAPYGGPIDGKMNPQLYSAAKAVESILVSEVSGKMSGAIISSSKKFLTNPGDLESALSLIAKYKSSKKEASRKEKLQIIANSI